MLNYLLGENLQKVKELQKRVSAANPAPYDETPQYRDFMMWFPPVSLAAYIVASYWITTAFRDYLADIAVIIERGFPFFGDRIAFLGGTDSVSTAAFISTIMVGLLFTPVTLALHLIAYWKMSLRHQKYKPVTILSAVFILRGLALFLVIFWILFIDVPIGGHSEHVGMAVIFLWPVFPGIGSGITWVAESWIFCSVIALSKVTLSIWSKA